MSISKNLGKLSEDLATLDLSWIRVSDVDQATGRFTAKMLDTMVAHVPCKLAFDKPYVHPWYNELAMNSSLKSTSLSNAVVQPGG